MPEESGLSGKTIGELLAPAGEGEIIAVTRLCGDQRYLKPYMRDLVRADDRLLLEGSAEAIETVVHETRLQTVGTLSLDADALESDDVHLVEAVITPNSRLIGRTVAQAMFGRRHSLNLLALARQGRPIRKEILRVHLRAGDVLLLQGYAGTIPEELSALGACPWRSATWPCTGRRAPCPW